MSERFKSYDLTGRTALVTGASGLLGLEHSSALLESGAHVILTDINDAQLEKAKAKLAAKADATRIVTEVMDVTKADAIRAVAGRVGRVDILVNNAAIDPKVKSSGIETSRLENFALEQWNLEISVGLP